MSYSIKPFDDQSQWELFVLRHSPAALFQSWKWGEVQQKLGIPMDRYGIFHNKKLIGVFQVFFIRARRGSFLHVRHGPILEQLDSKAWEAVFAFLRADAVKLNCWFIRISPLIQASAETSDWLARHHLLPAAIHRMDGEHCWVLPLAPDEETLLSAMRKTTRYEIRRAQKEGVEVLATTNPAHLSEFFQLYEETRVRHGFVPHSGIREEFEVFAKSMQAVLYVAKHNKKTLASAIILYYGNQAIYHHGASIPTNIPASTLIQWEAIRDAKKRGMNVYNFWGIAPENNPKHPWRGITLFKKGFGGRELVYIHAHDLATSPFYVIPRAIETTRRIMRGYD